MRKSKSLSYIITVSNKFSVILTSLLFFSVLISFKQAGAVTITFEEYPPGTQITNQYQGSGVLFSTPTGPAVITYPSYYMFDQEDESIFGDITMTFVDSVNLAPTEVENFTMGYYCLLGGFITFSFYDVYGGLVDEHTTSWVYDIYEPPSAFHKMVITSSSNTYFWLGNVSYKITFPPPDFIDPGPSEECEAEAGAPINLTTGNVWISENDYSTPGLSGGLSVTRTWNSLWNHTNPPFEAGMFGRGWTSSYEERLQTLNNSYVVYWNGSGNTWVFWKDSDCSFCSYSLKSPRNQSASLRYDTSTTQYLLTFKDGSQKVFNQSGLLIKLIDLNGNETTITHDSLDRIVTVTAPGGQWISYTYDDPTNSNQATSAYDSTGTIVSYSYVNSNLAQVLYSDSGQINYDYDAENNIVLTADRDGNILETHTYDLSGRGLTSSLANDISSLSIEYPSTTSTVLTDSNGNTTNYQFSRVANHNFLTDIQGSGCGSCGTNSSVSFTLDNKGNRLSRTDDNGNVTTFTYDSSGSILTRTNDVGTWSYTYNSFSEVLTAQDPRGNITSYIYDNNGNLTTINAPSPDGGTTPGPVTEFEYDVVGNRTKIIDPLGNATTFNYSQEGFVTSIKDSLRNLITFSYDSHGNRKTFTNAMGETTSYTYDSRNRLSEIINPDNSIIQHSYDHRGRMTSFTDSNNIDTIYHYDDADRLISVVDALDSQINYSYDNESNLVSITDKLNQTTSFEYNNLGRVTKIVFPSSMYETYSYDTEGNLVSKTDRNGQEILFSYDALNRLTEKSYPGYTAAYVYDSLNRLLQTDDPTGSYMFTYDELGRVIQTTTTYTFLPNQPFIVSYEYDAASNRTSMTNPESGTTTYSYNAINFLKSLIISKGNKFEFTYDDVGRRTLLTRPNSVTTNYIYDEHSHLLNIEHAKRRTTLDGVSYALDLAGYRISKTAMPSGTTTDYSYDLINQLTEVSQGAPTIENYTYDATGNRLSSIGLNPYSYNSSNQLMSTPKANYQYDNNGNLLTTTSASELKNFTWGAENRLLNATLSSSGESVQFKYDPFGRRIYKSSTLGTTIFIYDGLNLIEEVDLEGTVLAQYTYGPGIDEPLLMKRGDAVSYYHSDGLGSISSLTDEEGNIIATYEYDSFGSLIATTGTIKNPFRYTAREYDEETGLYFYRARYYDPGIGRFISEDPIGFRGGFNFYAYVGGNPVNAVDPLGLDKCIIKPVVEAKATGKTDILTKLDPRPPLDPITDHPSFTSISFRIEHKYEREEWAYFDVLVEICTTDCGRFIDRTPLTAKQRKGSEWWVILRSWQRERTTMLGVPFPVGNHPNPWEEWRQVD